MGYLRVAYVVENLIDPKKDYRRDIETFPLQIGKYRLKKHPLFSFWLLRYEHNTLTFAVKNDKYQVKVDQYTYFTYKKTKKKKVDIFFEIMDEEWVDEEVEVKNEEELTSLESVLGYALQVHSVVNEIDSYSNQTFEKDFELPVIKEANKYISTVEGNLIVKRIISENEIELEVTGHYGKNLIVTLSDEGIYKASDSYGYNDNFRAFSITLTIKLVKK